MIPQGHTAKKVAPVGEKEERNNRAGRVKNNPRQRLEEAVFGRIQKHTPMAKTNTC